MLVDKSLVEERHGHRKARRWTLLEAENEPRAERERTTGKIGFLML